MVRVARLLNESVQAVAGSTPAAAVSFLRQDDAEHKNVKKKNDGKSRRALALRDAGHQ